MSDRQTSNEVAVLVSGGIDSAVLTVELTRQFDRVVPIYVRFGLRWERAELPALRQFLGQVHRPNLAPLVILDEPLAGVYGDHWSLGGSHVPDSDSRDEEVFLPGRNLLLIGKAAVWCQIRGIENLALGTLKSNPFPDAQPAFFEDLGTTLSRGLAGMIRLIRPFEWLSKVEVMSRGIGLPLASTFSCLDPVDGQHCGACNKCAERRKAFSAATMSDPTAYRLGRLRAYHHESRNRSCIE